MPVNKLLTFSRSDLACEKRTSGNASETSEAREFYVEGFHVTELEIKAEGSSRYDRYVTIDIGHIWLDSDDRIEACTKVIAEQLLKFINSLTDHKDTDKLCLMVAGLGNRFITSDSLGPLTVDKLTVTRHMMGSGSFFELAGCSRLCAIQPGVLGQTGIEAAAIIKGAANEAEPDVIIAVDALAARSLERLATTVQISDSGIRPGSGIGNRRCAIDENSVGCPVVSIGVPTVVDSSTLVCDALEKAGMENSLPELNDVLENGRSFFVSPKDTDIISEELSAIISSAISSAAGI